MKYYPYTNFNSNWQRDPAAYKSGGWLDDVDYPENKVQAYNGLNKSNSDMMYFPNSGKQTQRTFRGLDDGTPVFVQDAEGKNKILRGANDTTVLDGHVIEKRMQQGGFNEYYKTVPQYKNDTSNYNLREYYNRNPKGALEFAKNIDAHAPDSFKLPNHPTFSNESIYFNDNNRDSAGHWEETPDKWMYIPYNSKVKDTIIEKKQQGGNTNPPIYVSNLHDPRLQAYQDSTEVYNSYKQHLDALRKHNYEPFLGQPGHTYLWGMLATGDGGEHPKDFDPGQKDINKYVDVMSQRYPAGVDNRFKSLGRDRYLVKDDWQGGQDPDKDYYTNTELPYTIYNKNIQPKGTYIWHSQDSRDSPQHWLSKNEIPTHFLAADDTRKNVDKVHDDVLQNLDYSNARPIQPVVYQSQSNTPTTQTSTLTPIRKLQHINIQSIPIGQPQELPISNTQQPMQPRNPEDMNTNPETWLSPQTEPFRPAGFYKQSMIPGQGWVPSRQQGGMQSQDSNYGWLDQEEQQPSLPNPKQRQFKGRQQKKVDRSTYIPHPDFHKFQQGGWEDPNRLATVNDPIRGISVGTTTANVPGQKMSQKQVDALLKYTQKRADDEAVQADIQKQQEYIMSQHIGPAPIYTPYGQEVHDQKLHEINRDAGRDDQGNPIGYTKWAKENNNGQRADEFIQKVVDAGTLADGVGSIGKNIGNWLESYTQRNIPKFAGWAEKEATNYAKPTYEDAHIVNEPQKLIGEEQLLPTNNLPQKMIGTQQAPNPIFSKQPQKLLRDKDYRIQMKKTDALNKANEWLKNWYSNPEIIQRAKDLNNDKLLQTNPEVKFQTQNFKPEYPEEDSYEYGSYMPFLNSAVVNPHIPMNRITPTGIHEGTHFVTKGNYNLSPESQSLLSSLFPNRDVINQYAKESPKFKEIADYYTDPTEIHARINELRHHFGYQPEDILTVADANNILTRGVLGETPVDKQFFNFMINSNAKGSTASNLANVMNKMFTPIGIGVGVGAASAQNNKKLGGNAIPNWLDKL